MQQNYRFFYQQQKLLVSIVFVATYEIIQNRVKNVSPFYIIFKKISEQLSE